MELIFLIQDTQEYIEGDEDADEISNLFTMRAMSELI